MEPEGGGWGEDVSAAGVNHSASAARRQRIKKRALKNKVLSVGFDEKDLRDFVTGFHKRKKKRRKIAQRQLQEKKRLQRIEGRRKRKLERELALYGGVLPTEETPKTTLGDEDDGNDVELDSHGKIQSVSGTKMYENEVMTITVTTGELPHEEEDLRVKHQTPQPSTETEKSRHLLPKKKPLKRVANQRSCKKHKKSASQRKTGKKGRRR